MLDAIGRIVLPIFLLVCMSGPACADSDPVKTYRIAMVLPRPEGKVEAAFRDFFIRRNIHLETEVIQYSGKPEDQPLLIARLRKIKPDLIYTWGTPSTLAVAGRQDEPMSEQHRYIRDIPIVFASIADPVAAHLVNRLDRPGRNLTGASHLAPLSVQLKTINSYRPFKAIGYLYNPQEPNAVLTRAALAEQAQKEGFTLHALALPLTEQNTPDTAAIPQLIAKIKQAGSDFLYIGPDTLIGQKCRDLVTLAALNNRLASFSAIESPVRESKALFGLFSPQANVGRFAASKALKILEGQSPVSDIAIETLPQFSLLINMEVAKALTLYPPLTLLKVAEVISPEDVPAKPAPQAVALR